MSLRAQRALLGAIGALLGAFLLLPLLTLVATPGWLAGLAHPAVWPAARLSLTTSLGALALAVLLGTPLAWRLARSDRGAARLVERALQLPMVLPPAVAGVALLLAFGRRGPLAGWLYPADWSPAFSTAAVVLAQLFVAAPLYVQAAASAFRELPRDVLDTARAFGAGPLRLLVDVALPLSRRALVAGGALAWARGLGEFGATLLFAGNLPGETQTLPLAIYAALEADWAAARGLAVVLVALAAALLVVVHLSGGRRAR